MSEAFTPNIKRVATPERSSEAAVRRGKRLLKEKQFDEALEVFEELVRNEQADNFVHTAIGRIKTKRKDLDGALAHFQTAIKLDPSKPQGYIRSARILFSQGQLDQAREALNNAIRVQPKASAAYVGLGIICQREKKPELAISHYEKALSFNPRMVAARKRLAQVLSKVGRMPDAMAQANAALRIQPEDAEGYALKGRLHLVDKEYEEAQRAYERAVELEDDGGDTRNRLGLAEAYIHGGKLVQGEQTLRSLSAREQSPLLHKLWGDIYNARGMHREALEEYRAASLAIDDDFGIEGLQDMDLMLDDGEDEQWEAIAGKARAGAQSVIDKRRHG